MIHIAVIDQSGDKHFFHKLSTFLCTHFNTLYLSETRMEQIGMIPEFLIASVSNITDIHLPDTLVIFRNLSHKKVQFRFSDDILSIVDSDQQYAMNCLAGQKVKAITCGLSLRDTLTLSSISSDSAVIALQRSILTFGGKVIEPIEIPVKLASPPDPFFLLCVAAILLLSEHTDLLESLCI